jgi:hypothetical protein
MDDVQFKKKKGEKKKKKGPRHYILMGLSICFIKETPGSSVQQQQQVGYLYTHV